MSKVIKIRSIIFPEFRKWFNNPKKSWKKRFGRYYFSIERNELFGKKFYAIEITCRGYPGYVDYIYKDAIKITKSKKDIKKWYKKTLLKANKAWRKELRPFFIK